MRKLLNIILMVALSVATASCVEELNTGIPEDLISKERVRMTFSASFAGDTKTMLVNGTEIWWEPGDMILINGDPFYATTEVPSKTTDFVGETVPADEYYALFSEGLNDVIWNNGSYEISSHTVQVASAGELPAYLSAAKCSYDNLTLNFVNLLGYVKFTLPEDLADVSEFVVSTNAGEILSGNMASIDFSSDRPALAVSELDEYAQKFPYVMLFAFFDAPADYYVAMYPGTYSEGLKFTFRKPDGREAIKKIERDIVLEPGVVQNLGLIKDLPAFVDPEQKIRDALIRLYNETDGDKWINNEGWCTDAPVYTWYGVWASLDARGISEMDINLSYNNLKGAISKDVLSALESLTRLDVSNNYLASIDLTGNSNLNVLSCGGNIFSELDLRGLDNLEVLWCSYGIISSLLLDGCVNLRELYCMGTYLSSLDLSSNVNLKYLYAYDTRLEELDLSKCVSLEMVYCYNNHPSYGLRSLNVAGLQNLREISCWGSFLETIDVTSNPNLEVLDFNVDYLSSIDVSKNPKLRNLSGSRKFAEPDDLPEGSTRITEIDLSNNLELEVFRMGSKGIRNIDFSRNPKLRNINVTACRLESLDVSCLPLLEELTCNNCGLTSLDVSSNMKLSYFSCMRNFISELDFSSNPELKFIWCTENLLTNLDVSGCPYLERLETWSNPNLENIYVLSTQNFEYSIDDWTKFAFKDGGDWGQEGEDPDLPELYESVDYSQDGVVVVLQAATKGKGIDIVFMGDGYSDRLIADGTYDDVMHRAMENFFSEEPYKSFRDYFNVYYVNVVSQNEVFEDRASTALSCYFGEGTSIGVDLDKVLSYTMNVLDEDDMDDATVIVTLNSSNYAGSCYMYLYNELSGDYANGFTVSLCPTAEDNETFAQIIQHEAGGHGFGKLGDEYSSSFNGTIPDYEIEGLDNMGAYGWYRNIDVTDDPTKIKWSHFLSDERYAGEGLGIYEGAFTYAWGAYRPSYQSIMRHNIYGFNAPSREAIYYRIHKLAYGPQWEYDYEDFVEYDAINRGATTKSAVRNYVEKNDFVPLAPPVIIKGDWRDGLR